MPSAPTDRPLQYRDREDRVWYVSEVARLKVVSASIDGSNLCLVIRFEREGEERFARWIGGDDWLSCSALHRLFAEAEGVEGQQLASPPRVSPEASDTGVGPAPPETVEIWMKLVATMGPDELADFEERTFRQWDRSSLKGLRGAIEYRRRQLGGK